MLLWGKSLEKIPYIRGSQDAGTKRLLCICNHGDWEQTSGVFLWPFLSEIGVVEGYIFDWVPDLVFVGFTADDGQIDEKQAIIWLWGVLVVGVYYGEKGLGLLYIMWRMDWVAAALEREMQQTGSHKVYKEMQTFPGWGGFTAIWKRAGTTRQKEKCVVLRMSWGDHGRLWGFYLGTRYRTAWICRISWKRSWVK